jgi:hypothetical protein
MGGHDTGCGYVGCLLMMIGREEGTNRASATGAATPMDAIINMIAAPTVSRVIFMGMWRKRRTLTETYRQREYDKESAIGDSRGMETLTSAPSFGML